MYEFIDSFEKLQEKRSLRHNIHISDLLTCFFYFLTTVGTFLVSGEEADSDNILHTRAHSGALYLISSILLFLTVSNCSKALSCHFRLMSYEGFDGEIYLRFSRVYINTKN